MNPAQNIHFWDPVRWIIGENPPWFMFEVIGRAVFIYIMLQVVLRLMGRRMASQMTTSEMAVVVTLGAAIGVPMQVPDRGMLAALLIVLIALVFQRGLAWLTFRYQKVELVAMGDVVTIVEDGRILMNVMEELVLSRERLFSVLRAEGIKHLGEIERTYAEATGSFTIYKADEPTPGLSILPDADTQLRSRLQIEEEKAVCHFCGATRKVPGHNDDRCVHCSNSRWTHAVLTRKKDSQ